MKRYAADEVRPRFERRKLRFEATTELLKGIEERFGEPLAPAEAVRRVVRDVEARGDEALDFWSERLDGSPVYEVPKKLWREAYDELDYELREALEEARARVRAFHKKEPKGGFLAAEDGVLAQLVRPLSRVGV